MSTALKENEIGSIVSEFITILKKHVGITNYEIHYEFYDCGHHSSTECKHPNRANPDMKKVAVYLFQEKDEIVLKVGFSGPRSYARYESHHYSKNSSPSNLPNSLIKDGKSGENIGRDYQRINFIICPKLDEKTTNIRSLIFVGKFFESFLHVKYNPVYEG